jgi:hypothetical protein
MARRLHSALILSGSHDDRRCSRAVSGQPLYPVAPLPWVRGV